MPAHDADEYDPTSGGSRLGHTAKLKLPTVVSVARSNAQLVKTITFLIGVKVFK